MRLTPDGLPSHHVYDENKKPVAVFVSLKDAELFVAAANGDFAQTTDRRKP